jgi:antitoxin (DNA-binding transcriptional repressor) of toxin-antitoxin stability system
MTSLSIDEAQLKLRDVVHGLAPGDEVLIVENDQTVARLLPAESKPQSFPRQLGTMRGTVLYMAPDFDAPLEDFEEYME